MTEAAQDKIRAFAQEFSIRHYGKAIENLSSEDRARVDCAVRLVTPSFLAERENISTEQLEAALESRRQLLAEAERMI